MMALAPRVIRNPSQNTKKRGREKKRRSAGEKGEREKRLNREYDLLVERMYLVWQTTLVIYGWQAAIASCNPIFKVCG